ncbi:MAG: monofunctional biosynthetic peptidoglycan transglycosylase [Rhizobiales bacterium]|nr:monofunctional biosynthetic peptidoglycan transglycosylase [Hyphomicrobiales bacterium]MBI3674229.1 monofunctional biosynthetic peptidoglycan transglycosylase [Hyphomicrobiales bacterium]
MTTETQPVAEDVPLAAPVRTSERNWRKWLRRLIWLVAILVAWPLVMTLIYAFVAPPFSNVMLLRALSGNGIDKTWVSLDQMSPWLAKAVITSEDARFCEHHGVDWIEVQGVVDDALDASEAPIRGASTIPMQTAKNLFLWDGRFFIRKGLEIPLALWMDLVWSKRRMAEIYLNIVEWAPGVYGAEAAARYHFNKPAAKLTRREAALLAAVLPNPIKRNAGKPSRGVAAIANRILIRMNGMGPYLACLDR